MFTSKDIKIKAVEKHFEILSKKYLAESAKQDMMGEGASKVEIDLKLKQLEKEMEEADRELKKLRQLDPDTGISYREYKRNWEENFPKIDFAKANKIVDDILKKYEQKQGVALFLLPNSSEMGGEWLLQGIKARLKGMGNYSSPVEYHELHHEPITESKFLEFLEEKYHINVCSDSIELRLEQAIDKICKSFYPGSILLISIELRRIETKHTFLKWFIDKFWGEFTSNLEQMGEKGELVKVIAVLSIEKGNIPKNYLLDSQYCTKTKFDGRKILKLPLQLWKKEDIRTWLISFSGLVNPPIAMPIAKIELIAESIYEQTKGKPREVEGELKYERDEIWKKLQVN